MMVSLEEKSGHHQNNLLEIMNLNTQSGMIWTAVLIICYFDIPILRLGKNSAKENKKRSCLFVTKSLLFL